LSDGFAAEGGKWVDTAIGDPNIARATGINRIFDGDPPTAMQFNPGKQFDSLVSNGMLRSLDDLADEQAWQEKLPPLLVDAVT
jgi:glucose/mannose transport system substrate-binding protein